MSSLEERSVGGQQGGTIIRVSEGFQQLKNRFKSAEKSTSNPDNQMSQVIGSTL